MQVQRSLGAKNTMVRQQIPGVVEVISLYEYHSLVILYALLAGNLPFDDDSIRRLLSKVIACFIFNMILGEIWKISYAITLFTGSS